jgi:hypothetical protein
MTVNANPYIVTSNLLVNLDAGNPRSYPGSGTTWTDVSGNGLNATLYNSVTYNSSNSGSLVLDGNTTYGQLSCATFQSGNGVFSMEAWFYWAGNGVNTNNTILGYGNDIAAHLCPSISITGGKFHFQFGSGSGIVESSALNQNTWYQGVGVYDQSTTKVYINGSLVGTTNYSSANVNLNGSNGTNAGIGTLFSIYGNVTGPPKRYGTFNGRIARLLYYNKALTAQEIAQNFNAMSGRYGL